MLGELFKTFLKTQIKIRFMQHAGSVFTEVEPLSITSALKKWCYHWLCHLGVVGWFEADGGLEHRKTVLAATLLNSLLLWLLQ